MNTQNDISPEQKKKSCPSCGRELEANLQSANCPHCNVALPKTPVRKFNWPLFFVALFKPVLLTVLTVGIISNEGDFAPNVAGISSGIGGIICGTLLGRRFGNTDAAKWVLGIVFSAVFAVVCFLMSCFGCMASGYQLNFH